MREGVCVCVCNLQLIDIDYDKQYILTFLLHLSCVFGWIMVTVRESNVDDWRMEVE